MNELTISDAELADNPTARVPICVLLDVSDSMKGDPIRELNEGLKAFIEEILSDDMTRYSADIAILTFGGIVTKVFDFGSIEDQEVPEFKATAYLHFTYLEIFFSNRFKSGPMGATQFDSIDFIKYFFSLLPT